MIGDILPGILAECGINRASPDISAPDFEMTQIKALMNAAGKDINTRAEWSKASQELTGFGAALALPADFQKIAANGPVMLANGSPGLPVVDPTLWQFLEKNAV